MNARRLTADLLVFCALIGFALPTALKIDSRLKRYDLVQLMRGSDWENLVRDGEFFVIDFVNRYIPEDERVLVFRQNSFVYYGERRILRDLDPRMIAAYQASTKEQAFETLGALGVRYVSVPGYDIPTLFNTPVGRLLADPRYARLIVERSGYALYRLLPPKERPATRVQVIGSMQWIVESVNSSWRSIPPDGLAVPGSGRYSVFVSSASQASVPPQAGSSQITYGTYHVRGALSGRGLAYIYLLENKALSSGKEQSRILRTLVLKGSKETFEAQFRTGGPITAFRLVVEVVGEGEFRLFPTELNLVEGDTPFGVEALTNEGHAWSTATASSPQKAVPVRIVPGMQTVYSGAGHFALPPSAYGDGRFKLSSDARWIRASLVTAGEGQVRLSVYGYDANEFQYSEMVGRLRSEPQQTSSEWLIGLRDGLGEYRLGLSPSGGISGLRRLLNWLAPRLSSPRLSADKTNMRLQKAVFATLGTDSLTPAERRCAERIEMAGGVDPDVQAFACRIH